MKIACFDRSVGELLKTHYYHIPRFQRPYSWESDNVEEFWSDAVVQNTGEYFIGSIVVFKKNDVDKGIVDGQQRLTTIMIILAAIRELYKRLGEVGKAQGIQGYIERVNIDNEKLFVIQTESSFPYFQDHILSSEASQTEPDIGFEELRIKQAFELITSKLIADLDVNLKSELSEEVKKRVVAALTVIRDKVTALKLIFIEVDNEDDAYLIFETLNTRGKDLRTGDLVKNYITKNLRLKNSQLDVAKEKWNKMISNIEEAGSNIDLDEFIHHYWLSRYEYIPAKNLFKVFRKTIPDSECRSLLDDLLRDSKTYSHIFDVESRDWTKNERAVKDSLLALSIFRVKQHAPFVLAILRDYFKQGSGIKEVRNALRMIESFHFIFTAITAQRSGGSLAKWYSKAAKDYTNATNKATKQNVITELRKKLKSVLPSEDEFALSFSALIFTDEETKHKKLIQYFLGNLVANVSVGVPVDLSRMTIEHIAPQRPPAQSTWKVSTSRVGLIGNLIYVSEALNDRLGTRPYGDKKALLVSSAVPMDNYIKKHDSSDWTDNDIELRTKELSRLAYNTLFKI